MPLRASRCAALAATLSLSAALTTSSMAAPDDAPGVVRKASPSNLEAVLQSARSGDTIVLAPGEYGPLKFTRHAFARPLVIEAGPAVFLGLNVGGVEGLELRGGEYRVPPPNVKPSSGNLVYGAAIRFDEVKNIRLLGLKLVGPGAPPGVLDGPFGEGNGVLVNGGENIEITKSHFSGLKNGIAMGKTDGFKITDNVFSGLRSDGASMGEVRNGLIQGNECSGTRIRSTEHPDCIQLWSRPTSPPTADVVIRRNRAEGPTQGVFLGNHTRDGVDDGGFDRILIEENDLNVGFPNAIALTDGRESIVRNNRIRTFPGAQYPANINIRGDVKRCGNEIAANEGRARQVDKKCD
jgi:hypothetical protein